MLKITLVKSINGTKKNQSATVKALGLKKIGDSKTLADSPALQGKIFVIKHLVKVEQVD